jgi:hypothetical protein
MVNRFLPRPIDNTYGGHRLALWLFGLAVSLKILQSLFVIFNGYSVVTSADGIPLDTYTPASAQTVVAVSALSGLSRLVVCLLCVLVLARYRSAIPFMLALLVLEILARELILHFDPIIRTGTPPAPFVNLIVLALLIVGLVLSLWNQGNRRAKE